MANRKIQILVIHLTVGLSLQSCLDVLGQNLPNGTPRNSGGCVPETCKGGNWEPDKDKISSECKVCNAWGDPHFTAFSGAQFDWQSPCNTALVQKGFSKNPEFGVFMDFQKVGKLAYVGTPTTYQDDKHNKVVLSPNPFARSKLTSVKANGVGRDIPLTSTPTLVEGTSVYAWTHQSTVLLVDGKDHRESHSGVSAKSKLCVRLYGKIRILVELCDSIIHIWAPPKGPHFPAELEGFCGSNDKDSTAFLRKQLVARDRHAYTNPGGWLKHPVKAWGDSWKASEQTKSECRASGFGKRSLRERRAVDFEMDILHKNCTDEADNANSLHHDTCMRVHTVGGHNGGDDHHAACKYDLCVATNDKEHQDLGYNADKMLELHTEIHARTRAHIRHTNTISKVHNQRPSHVQIQHAPRPSQNVPYPFPPGSFQNFQIPPVTRTSQNVQYQIPPGAFQNVQIQPAPRTSQNAPYPFSPGSFQNVHIQTDPRHSHIVQYQPTT